MNRFVDKLTDIRLTLIASLLFHFVLAIILLLINVGVHFETTEFSEISFVSGRGELVQPTRSAPRESEPAEHPTPAPAEETGTEPSEAPSEIPVNLPKRRMLEPDESTPIRRLAAPKKSPGERTDPSQTNRAAKVRGERVQSLLHQDERYSSTQTATEETPTRPTAGPITPSAGSNQPYTIEGEAADRSVIRQTIPAYPAGLQKEAVVKIRFTVLPDGHIGRMIPVKKGDPRLEDITLKALQSWQFNPLPPTSPQDPVDGIITFRYQLE